MKTNKEIRESAREELKGYWTMPVLATLLYFFITAICDVPNTLAQNGPVSSRLLYGNLAILISIFVMIPLGYGFTLAFLRFLREDKEDTVEQIFGGFKTYGRAIGVTLLLTVYILLWCFLLIIPGIIKAFSYSMTIFISKDHPELSANECIDRSIEMMDGHKAQLFWLYLGFIGLMILSVFTLFIGCLWIVPYMQVSMATFYENLKEETETNEDEPLAIEE